MNKTQQVNIFALKLSLLVQMVRIQAINDFVYLS